MAIAFKDSTRNYALDQLYDNKFPSGSTVEIRTGAAAGANNAAGGSLLVGVPNAGWAAAASGSKAKSGAWSANASGTGTAGHYRHKNAADTEREEGTVTVTGGGGDMTLDSTSITSPQTVTITGYTRTLP